MRCLKAETGELTCSRFYYPGAKSNEENPDEAVRTQSIPAQKRGTEVEGGVADRQREAGFGEVECLTVTNKCGNEGIKGNKRRRTLEKQNQEKEHIHEKKTKG